MIVDTMIHRSLTQDADSFYKARVLATIVLVYLTIVAVTVVYVVGFAPLDDNSRLFAISLMLALIVVYLTVLTSLKYLGSYNLCCHLSCGSTALAVMLGVIFSGGPIESPATPVNIVAVVLAFVLLGKRAGLKWAQWVLLAHAGLTILALGFVEYPQYLDIKHMTVLHGLHWVVTYSAIIGLMLVYDSINTRLKRERDDERARFRYLASHDPLTDLANRMEFEEQFEKATERSDANHTVAALVFIDLDGFKPVNDGLGHAVGDEVLKRVSYRLKSQLRGSDTVARLGGDEFAVILDGLKSEKKVTPVVEKILAAITEDIEGVSHEFPISASIGVAIYPFHGRDRARLVHFADTAMYRAKKHKNTYRIYEPSLDDDPIGRSV